MKLVIFTTNRYPKYDREELPFETLEAAERKMNELSAALMERCRAGELQDYQLEIRN